MRLGYGTYAMKSLDVFEAIPRIHDLGYEALEICVREGWPTSPDRIGKPERARLAAALQGAGFPSPPLMDEISVCSIGGDRTAMLQAAGATFELAGDLKFDAAPAVVTTTLGSPQPDWSTSKWQIRDAFLEIADLAGEYDVIVAAEPHAGGEFETPEKAQWLMEQTDHDHLKLNFDISHFVAQGIGLQRSVDLCAPHTVHTHIKDGYMENGHVHYQLPGDGDLDLVDYFKAVHAAGIGLPIYVEVSRQISELEGYDPWLPADQCFSALDAARKSAGTV